MAGVPRYDYAVFDGDRFVTNALLTPEEVERMESDGARCVRVDDKAGWGVPAFRGRRYVTGQPPFRKRWWQN